MKKILPAVLLVGALLLSLAGCQQEEQKGAGVTASAPKGAGVNSGKKPGGNAAELGSAQMQQGVSEQEAASRVGSAVGNK